MMMLMMMMMQPSLKHTVVASADIIRYPIDVGSMLDPFACLMALMTQQLPSGNLT